MRNLYADFAGKLDSLLDTPEEARLIESTKSDEKKVKAEFEQFIARHNSSLALRFWLWLSAAVEAGRTVFGLLGAFRAEDANVISLQLYYSILSAIILVITLIGIIPSVLTKKDSEKYYKLML